MTPLLLDTCALIWVATGEPISGAAEDRLREAAKGSAAVCISPISAWEVGLLVARGKIALSMPPQAWLGAFLAQPGVELAPMPVDTLVDSSFLPGSPPRDPADRIILATARSAGMRILTRDRAMLEYANQGHAWAVEC